MAEAILEKITCVPLYGGEGIARKLRDVRVGLFLVNGKRFEAEVSTSAQVGDRVEVQIG